MYSIIDVGGTNIRITASTVLNKGSFLSNLTKFRRSGIYKEDTDKIFQTLIKTNIPISHVILALPGVYDYGKKKLTSSNNMSEWIDMPFVVNLENQLDTQVEVYKDIQLAAIGEGYENSFNLNRFLYLSWGTGIGGSIVNISSLSTPRISLLDWASFFCKIENQCSGNGVFKRFGVKLEYLDDNGWDNLINEFIDAIEHICKKLEIANVVLGGGITSKRRKEVETISKQLISRGITLYGSILGDDSAIYGGYWLLKKTITN